MKTAPLISLVIFFCAAAQETTYYISPTGNDAAAGTAVSTPWKTFVFAIPKLRPGDSLILLDGTYNETNSGFPVLNNINGTASQPITIKAQNERKAHVRNNGLYTSLIAANCSYLVLEGLQLSSADNASVTNSWTGAPMSLQDCHHITVKRLLAHHNNRYGNTHLVTLTRVTNSLFVESEFYYHHRHCIMALAGNLNIFRRLYFSSRGYGVIPGGKDNGNAPGGDDGIALYPGKANIIENCISEGLTACHTSIQAVGESDSNRILGNIAIGPNIGLKFNARPEGGFTELGMPKYNFVENFVALDAKIDGVRFLSVKGQRLAKATILNSTRDGVCVSWVGDANGKPLGDSKYSFFGDNILAVSNVAVRNDAFGIVVDDFVQAWTIDHMNSYGNLHNYWPTTSSNYISPISIDPKLGTCKVWIPDSSPMKGAGKNGEDIGANILYRYQDGVLTNQPLWDPRTGEFPRGAVVQGINDIPGQSLFDVHKRLNVNCNNCPFPAGYPSASAISNAQRSNAARLQQAFLTITPNFAGSSISIKTDPNHPATVEIYNLQGKKIETLRNIKGNSVQWNLGNQPAGVYFVKTSSRRITATAKMLVAGR